MCSICSTIVQCGVNITASARLNWLWTSEISRWWRQVIRRRIWNWQKGREIISTDGGSVVAAEGWSYNSDIAATVGESFVSSSTICTSGASIQPECSDHAPEPGSKTVLIQLVFLKCNSHLWLWLVGVRSTDWGSILWTTCASINVLLSV